jgi:hypothetical protein
MIHQNAEPEPGREAATEPAAIAASQEQWLLLVHQLPTRPVSLRVRTWRRMQQLGAVAVKSSVYALPNRPETREDFEWVRAEIVAAGGQATVFQASTIDTVSSDDLREAFRRDRHQDYRELVRAVEKIVRAAGGRPRHDPRALPKALRMWRERLAEIEALDYFGARGRDDARAAVARLEAVPGGAHTSTPVRDGGARIDPAAFQQRRWLTRPRPGIDRMASAWLIRRLIDPHAIFVFAEPDAPREPGTVTFDMFEGDFTHEGDRCTFEVLCARFGLSDARLREVAELVHDLDLKDARFGRAEAPLLGALVEGLRQLHDHDEDLLERGIGLFDALYQGLVASATPPRQTRGTPTAGRRRRTRGT